MTSLFSAFDALVIGRDKAVEGCFMACATGGERVSNVHVFLFSFLFGGCVTLPNGPSLCSVLLCKESWKTPAVVSDSGGKGGFLLLWLLQLSEMKMLVLWQAHQWWIRNLERRMVDIGDMQAERMTTLPYL